MPTIYKTNHLDDFIQKSVDSIESFLMEQLQQKKLLRVALSGGSSPVPVYQALAKSKKIDWSRIALFLVDERYIPVNSKDSNTRMLKEALIDQVKNLRKFYHYNTRKPITELVDQYQRLLQSQEEPLFDLVILGLGADGHTASLFPHSAALHEKRRLVMHTQTTAHAIHDRLTLTFPALLNSEKIVFLIQGKSKEEALRNWLEGEASLDELPAKGVLSHPNNEIFYYNG